VRVFLSSDIEGCAGISDWDQVRIGAPEFAIGRSLLLGEVNAAIEGAHAAGATHVLVNDAHSTMHNLDPAALAGRASYLSGADKPLYMMEGLDDSFDAVFMVAYHGSIGAERAILSHTYNPAAIHEVRINDTVVGESGLNALVALHHGVPVALITGDEATMQEAEPFLPQATTVVVKRSITRFAAESLHPARARELIAAGAARALGRPSQLRPPAIALPATVEVDFLTADMAEAATLARDTRRVAPRTVATSGDDPLELYRRFTAMITLTRPLGGR
jgi:D-amino peptidase